MDLLNQEKRRVWIEEHPQSAYAPGRVEEVRDDGTFIVVDDDGGSFMVQAAKAQTVDPACLTGVDDLLMLNDFNEAALLHNIRVRHAEDKIYTGVGSPILISVNPYSVISGLYSSTRQREYRNAGAAAASGRELGLPPHLYSVADAAYRTMLSESVNQSIIISGESGAGKTEATKRVLAFLADMQRHDDGRQASKPDGKVVRRSIEQQVLDANPVLEAFGNAKTVRNDNSSRFGKFVEVEFDNSGKLLSAQINNYLLEKCRIVTQQPEERNYHVFYQLLAGVSSQADLNAKLQLQSAADYEYTQATDTIPGVDDVEEFKAMLECMLNLGFTAEERDTIFAVVAAVLHLGNLSFITVPREGQDGVQISDEAQVTLISDLLGVKTDQLHSVMEHRTLEDRLTKKVIHMPQDEKSAAYTRHSMAKVAYARLFDWLVWRINQSMSGQGTVKKDTRRIGLLDIYGFEVFEWNSFEQLCINFANEKLQHHFNSHMFTLEQGLYTREGISWNHITFQDNQHIIDALEKRPTGLFCLVDSECVMPGATDMTLLNKIYNGFKSSKIIYKPSRFASVDFAVAHYAGEVTYSVETFLEKNTDKLHSDIVNLFKTSKIELLKTLFTDPKFSPDSASQKAADKDRTRMRKSRSSVGGQEGSGSQRQNVTVGMVFREQLDRLVEELSKTNPRYVRCIKPNANKRPREFDSIDVLRQLRCAGMLESIRIRHAGYAVRRPFKDFFQRFRLLAPHLVATGADPDFRLLCEKLLSDVEQRLRKDSIELPEKSWQMGQTRVFMKDEVERHCERLLVERSKRFVILIQTTWRRFSQRKRYLALQSGAKAMQALFRTHLAMQKLAKAIALRRATLGVQSALRMHLARVNFLRRRRAIVSIQRFARGWWCRRRIGQIKGKMAAARVQRMREEEERKQALTAAKKEAEEQKQAMEAMQRQMEAQQAEVQKAAEQEKAVQQQQQAESSLREIETLQEEKRALLERVQAAEEEATKAQAAAAAARAAHEAAEAQGPPAPVEPQTPPASSVSEAEFVQLERQNDSLRATNEELQRHIIRLQEDLRIATDGRSEAERHVQDLRKEITQLRAEASAAAPVGTAGGQPGTQVMEGLRSELLTHIANASSPAPTGPLGTAGARPSVLFRPVGTDSGLDSGRRTIVCQEEIFHKLKQQFCEALGNAEDAEDENIVGFSLADSTEEKQLQQLEEEVRRLRRENASLKTEKLSLDDEAVEKRHEADTLILQVGTLKAELEASNLDHTDEVSKLNRDLHETLTSLRKQTEEMATLSSRLQEAESTGTAAQVKARKAEEERQRLQEQLAHFQKNHSDMEQQLGVLQQERTATADQLSATRRGEQEWMLEQTRMREDIARLTQRANAKAAEATQAQRTIEELMTARVPAEELRTWRARAEMFERDYNTAIRKYQEMSSAVSHMTQASWERGGDHAALQQQVGALQQASQQKEHELKMALLDKQELQKQLENFQVSCQYYQSKYKEKTEELKAMQGELASYQGVLHSTDPVKAGFAQQRGHPSGAAPAPSMATTCLVGAAGQQAAVGSNYAADNLVSPTVMDLGGGASSPSRGSRQPPPAQGAAGVLEPPLALGSIHEDERRAAMHSPMQASYGTAAQPKRKAAAYPGPSGEGVRPELLRMAEAEDQRRAQRPAQEAVPLAGRESLLSQLNLNSRPGFTKKLGTLAEEQ
mmetsp:Transcript_65426/g.156435  ORF Transcript_65426/g.156435 Transcript_65426/m.156435 type:complete len:1692 (-) Transcript_65426:12-5087(-)